MGFFDTIQHTVQHALHPNPGTLPSGSHSPVQQGGLTAPGITGANPGSLLSRIGQGIGDIGRGISQEGLGGLVDPAGIIDRQRAQRELAGKFQVVGPDYHGPRNSNTVSQEEYQRIAHTYSDVRMGRGDLTLNTAGLSPEAAAKFRAGAMDDIGTMMQTATGRAEINALSHNPLRDGTGKPRLDAAGHETHHKTTLSDGSADPTNAGAMWANAADSANPLKGTDSNITYIPGHSINSTRSDVILAHEMRHSMDETQGNIDMAKVGAADSVVADRGKYAEFEHQAVGLGRYSGESINENAYRRERAAMGAAGATGLVGPRADGGAGDVGMVQRTSYNVLP